MDLGILSTIAQYAAGVATGIGVLLLLYLAPGVPLGWLKKLLWLSVVIAIWIVFVGPYQNDLKTWMICELSIFVFPLLTEQTVILISQLVTFLITWRLFEWILEVQGPQAAPKDSQFKQRKV